MTPVKDLLPIGSIVLLKDAEKRLMIGGVKQSNLDGEGDEFDYLGFLYPEGRIGDDFQYLFNHDDIEEIIFRGYEDPEREEFLEKLQLFYNE